MKQRLSGPGWEEYCKQPSTEDSTSAETRARKAELWNQDWYKVVEDMKHCAMFCMRDELAGLLSDGLMVVGESCRVSVTPEQKKVWANIIAVVKSCPMGPTHSDATFTMVHLSKAAKAMAALMDAVLDNA
jgi:hypothetical protein